MSPANLVNSLGLVFDILGVLLVWFFGLSGLLTSEGEIVTADFADGRNKRKIKLQNCFGKFGMFLIFLGFVFQLVSNVL